MSTTEIEALNHLARDAGIKGDGHPPYWVYPEHELVPPLPPTATPWGDAEILRWVAEGIWHIDATNGRGFWLSAEARARIPIAVAMETDGGIGCDGWFGSRCDDDLAVYFYLWDCMEAAADKRHNKNAFTALDCMYRETAVHRAQKFGWPRS